MATRTVSVKISGSALSLLLYENINVIFEQEGFLLGNVTKTVTKLVTDDTREDVKIKEIINISGVLPCDLPHMFYKSDGELLEDKLNDMLGPQKKNVIAWFKYKKYRKCGFRFTIREKILHEELTKFFEIPPHLFTCCVLTSMTSENKSTQAYSHAFVNINDGQFKMIPMHIENLGDACHTYQPNTKTSEPFLSLFNKINKNQSNIQIGTDIHNQLQTELKKSITNLASSEQKLSQLRQEIHDLNVSLRKSNLNSNKWVSEQTTNDEECKEIIVEVPITLKMEPTKKARNNEGDVIEIVESGPEMEETEQPKLNDTQDIVEEKTAVVDLTISDEDDVPARKTRNQRAKTAKSKRGVRNT